MRCTGYGLTIDTAFELPGAVPCSDRAVDLAICEGDATLPDPEVQRGAYSRSEDRIGLAVPDVGRFGLDGPERLVVEPDAAATPADVSELLIASALPMALWSRGGVLLHGSGVELSAGVVAIAGASGSGKSTLSRMLVEQGALLAGDDSLWLREGDAGITAYGLAGGWFMRDGEEREFHPVSALHQTSRTNLSAVVVLTPGELPEPRRLDPVAAVQALLLHRHRPNIPALLGIDTTVLACCTRIAASVPVYALGRVEGDPGATAAAIAKLGQR